MPIYALGELTPVLGKDVYVADTGIVIGNVTLGDESSIWFGTVVRGDVHSIKIGARTNIQDNSLVHVTNDIWPTVIGNDVTVGHNVILHGCTVGDRCLIGMGSTILDGAIIGEDSIIGAGSLITPNTVIPPRKLVMGRPGRAMRDLEDHDLIWTKAATYSYVENAKRFRRELRRIDDV